MKLAIITDYFRGNFIVERVRYIRVPKDIKAMKDYDYGVQKDEQMEELILSESQYSVFYT